MNCLGWESLFRKKMIPFSGEKIQLHQSITFLFVILRPRFSSIRSFIIVRKRLGSGLSL